MTFSMLRSAVAGLALLFATSVGAQAATYAGAPTAVGSGTSRVVVRTDAGGNPAAILLELSPGALRGLPPNDKANGEWEYVLAMPRGVATGIDHIAIDWNPHGHPPPQIYGAPHFDFHFYMVTRARQLAIAFPKGPKDPAAVVSDPALVAPMYRVFPDAAVPQMGVHAISLAAPELHHKPFTTTFLYGYYENRLIFLEPMITRAFLLSHPDVTMRLATPKKYSSAGWYPTKYVVRYDASRNVYVIALTGLRHWE